MAARGKRLADDIDHCARCGNTVQAAPAAIASGRVVVVNDDVVRGLGIAPETIQQVAEREGQ